MLTDAQIEELTNAVVTGQITQDEALALAREAALGAPTATTPKAPAESKPWQGMIQSSQLTAFGIVEAAIRRETSGRPRERELNVQRKLLEAVRTNYESYQDVIAKAKANDVAAREEAAEQRWLATTPEGRAECDRRTLAEAQAVLDAKAAGRTKADAARVILEEKHGFPSTANLTDAEVTDAVFGSSEGSER